MRQFGTCAHDGDSAADGPEFLHGCRESDLHVLKRRFPTVLDVPSGELLRAMSPTSDLSIHDDEYPPSARLHDVQHGAVPSAAEVPAALQSTGQLARHHLGVERRLGDLLHLEFRILEVEVLANPALQLVDDLPLAPDDHANPLSLERDFGAHRCALERPFEVQPAETGPLGLLEQVLAHELALDVGVDELANLTLVAHFRSPPQNSSSSSPSSSPYASRKISRLTW